MRVCVQSALEMYKEMVLLYLEAGRREVNSCCADLEPWQIIGATVITTLGAVWVKGFLFQQESNLSHMLHWNKVGLLQTKSEMIAFVMSSQSPKIVDAMFTKLSESYCNLQAYSWNC